MAPAPGSSAGLILPGTTSVVSVRINPSVLFQICDSYTRRAEDSDRVIGALLGHYTADGAVEVSDCYAVPHQESMGNQVLVDIDFHKNMYDLHQQVNAKDIIVGWYTTSVGIGSGDHLIHDFFGRETHTPVMLTVDTLFTGGRSNIKAFTSKVLSLGNKSIGLQFQEIQTDIKMKEAERIGLKNLGSAKVDCLPSDAEGLDASMTKLQGLLGKVLEYINDVIAGRKPANNEIGRFLMDTVAGVPTLSDAEFEKVWNSTEQDLLVVKFLAQLTRTNLYFAEKLRVASLA